MLPNLKKHSRGISLTVRVVPKSSKNNLSIMDDEMLKLKITAPPVDGKANEACIKYLSKLLGVPKTMIHIVNGEKSKIKTLEILGNPEELECVLLKNIDN